MWLLADWDGQLSEEARELVSWHITECQTCTAHRWGALGPAAFTRLVPPGGSGAMPEWLSGRAAAS